MPTAETAVKLLKNARRFPEVGRCIRSSPDWRLLVLGYARVLPVSYPVSVRTRAGDTLELVDLHDLITFWVIFCRNEYDVRPTDEVIVDAGANIGTFSIFAARRAPRARIVALEPFPSTVARLGRQLAANGLDGRVEVRPFGLAETSAKRVMSADVGPSQSRGIYDTTTDVTGIHVETTTLESFLETEKLGRIDLLKMDIEGAEHEVLLNAPAAVLARVRRIALEYHPNKPKAPLFARLDEVGFALVSDMVTGVNSGVAEFRHRTA